MWWIKGKPKTEKCVIFIWTLHYNHTTSSLEVTQMKSARSRLSSLCEALYHLNAVFDILRRNSKPLMPFFFLFFFFCKGAGYAWAKCGCSSDSPSGNIVVLVRSFFVTFHVVSVYERLDPFLQIARLWERKQFTRLWTWLLDKNKSMRTKSFYHWWPWQGISAGCRALTPAGYDWESSSSSWCAPQLHRSGTACLETHVLWCWPAPLPEGKTIQPFLMDFCTGNIHVGLTQFCILLWGQIFEKPWQMCYERTGNDS